MSDCDLRLGKWQDALADVEMVDAVVSDPPYSSRTHAGNEDMAGRFGDHGGRSLSYDAWSSDDVCEFVKSWAPRCRGWIVALTSDDLAPSYRAAYRAAGLYDFAPVPIVAHRVRLTGDGPASCAVYLMAARPRRKAFLSWGALPGWYQAGIDRGGHIGGKPLELMRAIVRDYSRPGDIVCDPCAGGGTTLLAARMEGRRAIGAEMDPTTHAKASARLAHMPVSTAKQPALFGGDDKEVA